MKTLSPLDKRAIQASNVSLRSSLVSLSLSQWSELNGMVANISMTLDRYLIRTSPLSFITSSLHVVSIATFEVVEMSQAL